MRGGYRERQINYMIPRPITLLRQISPASIAKKRREMGRETETEKRQRNKDKERQINYMITRPMNLLRQINPASSKEKKRDVERDRDREKTEKQR